MKMKLLGMSWEFIFIIIFLFVGIFFLLTRTDFGSAYGIRFYEQRQIKELSQIPLYPGAELVQDYQVNVTREGTHVYFKVPNDTSMKELQDFYLSKIHRLGWKDSTSYLAYHLNFSREEEGLSLDFDCATSPDNTASLGKDEDDCLGVAKRFQESNIPGTYQQIHLGYYEHYNLD